MRLPWRRAEGSASDEAHTARGESERQRADDEPARRTDDEPAGWSVDEPAAWRTLAPIAPIAGGIQPVVDQRFERSLTSWQSPQTLVPIDELVNVPRTATLVSGLALPERPQPPAPSSRSRTERSVMFPGAASIQRTLAFAASPPSAPAPPVYRELSAEPASPESIPTVMESATTPVTYDRVEGPSPDRPAPAAAEEPMVLQREPATPTAPSVLPERPAGTSDLPPIANPTLVAEPAPPLPAAAVPRRRGLGAPLERSAEPAIPAPSPLMPARPPGTATRPVGPAETFAVESSMSGLAPTAPPLGVEPVVGSAAGPPSPDVTVQLSPIGPTVTGWSDAPLAPEWTEQPLARMNRPLTRDALPSRNWRAGEPLRDAPLAPGRTSSGTPPLIQRSVTAGSRPALADKGGLSRVWTEFGGPGPAEAGSTAAWPPASAGRPIEDVHPLTIQRSAVSGTAGSASTSRATGPLPMGPSRPVDSGSVAVQAGVAQREADGSVTFIDPDRPAGPTTSPRVNGPAMPVIAREPAGSSAAPAPGTGPLAGGAGATTDLDDLAQRLYGRMRTLLKRDLLLDRERSGSLVRGPR